MVTQLDSPKHSLNIHEIHDHFDHRSKEIKVLSLDCFDTLLWRTVSTPIEVFSELQCHPLFVEHGISANSRRLAEREARYAQFHHHGHQEITIDEIYGYLLPGASSKLINELVDIEINAEKKFLFPYLPMFELLAKAHAAGLKTIVVSDMYIHEQQLKDLILTAASKFGIRPQIDHFFVSSKFRTTKKSNLFLRVAERLRVSARSILHYGDNHSADYLGAIRNGVNGFHFNRFTPQLEDTLQQSAFMQKLLLKDHGESEPVKSTVHALLSTLPPTENTLQELSWYQLGPMLCQYSYWLNEQAEGLIASGRKVKLAFMMRDGFLPLQIHQALQSQSLVNKDSMPISLAVSRFATLSLNFTSIESIKVFVQKNQRKLTRDELIFQLLGSDRNAINQLNIDTNSGSSWTEFTKQIFAKKSTDVIIKVAKKHKNNFIDYIKKEVGLQAGETLMLADLGYSGTIQDQITEVLKEDLQAEVLGFYLILRESGRSPAGKLGFIDYRKFSTNSIDLLLTQIQTLEQFTVSDDGSLLEYCHGGSVIHGPNHLSENQIELKRTIQKYTIDFAISHSKLLFNLWKAFGISPTESAGLLARFTIKPTASEIHFYNNFIHDINNGTNKGRWISNLSLSKKSILRSTAATFDSEIHKTISNDLNILQPTHAYLNLFQKRIGFKVSPTEFIDYEPDLIGIFFAGNNFKEVSIPCMRTSNGFKLAILSNINEYQGVGLRFGSIYSWLQIHTVCTADESRVISDPNWRNELDLQSFIKVEGGQSLGSGLIKFNDRSGFCFIDLQKANSESSKANCVVVIFREIAAQNVSQHSNQINQTNSAVTL